MSSEAIKEGYLTQKSLLSKIPTKASYFLGRLKENAQGIDINEFSQNHLASLGTQS